MKKKINILITCVGGKNMKKTLGHIKKSKKFNIKIIGTDMKNQALGRDVCHKFYLVPSASNYKNYIQKIKEIVEKNNINLVIPTSDEESLILSKYRNEIEKGNIKIANIDHATLEVFSNKLKTYKKLKEIGIKTAKFDEINSLKQLLKLIKKRKDFVIKPLISRGSRGVFVVSNKIKNEQKFFNEREIHCNTKRFFSKYAKKIKKYPLLLMERLEGSVFDLDIVAASGSIKRLVLRKRRVAQEPNFGHYIEKVPAKIKKDFKKIVKFFKLHWMYDCDLMKDKNGNLRILEINPRPSGSVCEAYLSRYALFDDLFSVYFNKKK